MWPPELNLIPIKADPNYLDRPNWFRRSDLNSSRTKFKRRKMLISVKLLACKIRWFMHWVGHMKSSTTESQPFQCRSTVDRNSHPYKAKGTAELLQIEIGVPNWLRRRTFCVLISMYEVRLMKSSASEPGLSFCFYLKEGVIFRVDSLSIFVCLYLK